MKTLLIIVALSLAGIFGYNALQPSQVAQSTHSFVTNKGTTLERDNAPFHSIGVNRYNLLAETTIGGTSGCANAFTNDQIDTMFSQLHDLGVTSIRFWLFQSFTQSGHDMSRFDYVLTEANKYNMVVIPVFENNWTECTEGGMKTADWYKSGYKQPYGSYQVSLADYIKSIVPAYKDNKTIMMWEIMNEAQDPDGDSLYAFASDLSGTIKSLDPNHLVSLGMATKDQSEQNYEHVNSLKTLDVLDYHDYDVETTPLPDQLKDNFTMSTKLGKPVIVGESGMQDTAPNRAQLFQAKIQAFFNAGGADYMIWSYGDSYVTNDGYNFGPTDPIAQMIKDATKQN